MLTSLLDCDKITHILWLIPLHKAEGGNTVSQVKVKEGESLDNALRRFKRQTSRDGVIQEVRKREHYEKPSVKRKKKSEAARKRNIKG